MLTYIASRISSGNTLFPDRIEINEVSVTYYKGNLVGYQTTIVARNNIASVYLGSGLLFADVIIETIGGKRITASGFKKSDAKSIVGLLSMNNIPEQRSVSQSVVVNVGATSYDISKNVSEKKISNNGKLYCIQCGKKLLSHSLFCTNCGTEI